MIDQEDNCTVILELNKSLGSADVIFFLRFGEGEEKRLHSKLDSPLTSIVLFLLTIDTSQIYFDTHKTMTRRGWP